MLDLQGFFQALEAVMAGRAYLLDHPDEDSHEKRKALYEAARLEMLKLEVYVATDPQLMYKPEREKVEAWKEAWKCYRVYQLARMNRAHELDYVEQTRSPYVYYLALGREAYERDRKGS